MQRSKIETLTGMMIIILASYLIIYVVKFNDKAGNNFYQINASFDKVDGLSVGDEVKLAGVTIGKVNAMNVNNKTFQVNIVMNIKKLLKIPTDSSFVIASSSMLGGKYISIDAGGAETYLKNNETAMFTQSAVSLEDLLAKFIFNSSNENKEDIDNVF